MDRNEQLEMIERRMAAGRKWQLKLDPIEQHGNEYLIELSPCTYGVFTGEQSKRQLIGFVYTTKQGERFDAYWPCDDPAERFLGIYDSRADAVDAICVAYFG